MSASKSVFGVLVFLCIALLWGGVSSAGEAAAGRFFLVGDGKLHIRNEKEGRTARIALLNADGTLNEASRKDADRIFGITNAEGPTRVSLRLLFLLDYFSDKAAPGAQIGLLSGYRSPAYNEGLKKSGGNVAKTSLHMDAMAVDFFIEGVDGKSLWEMIRQENCCGVGHYGGRSVHLDTGRPRFWEAATSGVQTGQSDYNRRIYLSTEYDRYAPGEKVRLVLASVSDFGFGIAPEGDVAGEGGSGEEARPLSVDAGPGVECVVMRDRMDAQSIRATLPSDLGPGKYRLRLQFCRLPYPEMPKTVLSNLFEIQGK